MKLTGNRTKCDDDLAVNRDIRKILVRHWIDLGRLTVSTNAGQTVLEGLLVPLPGSTSILSSHDVERLMSEIQQIPHLSSLETKLDNWVHRDGTWRPATA